MKKFAYSVIFGVYPLPPVYWNHRLSGKMQFDLWGTTTCGQNLVPKGFMPCTPSRESTASALTMMGSLREGRKVRCHNEAVDFAGISFFSP